MPSDSTLTIYVCALHASFSFRTVTKRFTFEKHVLRVQNVDDVADIDALLEDVPALAGKVQKTDRKHAEALAHKHRISQGGAHKGMFTSQQAPVVKKPLSERDAAFAGAPGAEVDAIDEKLTEQKSAQKKKSVPAKT